MKLISMYHQTQYFLTLYLDVISISLNVKKLYFFRHCDHYAAENQNY